MQEYLSLTFYNNTIQEWLIALSIIVSSFILAKVFYWIINKFVKRLTRKTRTMLDDIIVDMFEEPLVFGIVILGFWIGIKYLDFSPYPKTTVLFRNVFHILIAIDIAWFISRLFDALVTQYLAPLVEKSEGDLDDQLLPIVRKGVKALIWCIAIIVGLNNAGYDVAALLTGLGIGGLAFALAAQDTVSNFFGGFMIFVDKPFTIRDRIKISGEDGIVEEVGIRSTRVRTLEGRILTIPNSKFTKNIIENVSSEPNRKVVLNLGLTYDTTAEKIEEAIEILKEIVKNNDNVEDKQWLSFNAFGDFSLNILFVYYIKSGADLASVPTEMNLAILKKFTDAGLDFAFPTQTIVTENSNS